MTENNTFKNWFERTLFKFALVWWPGTRSFIAAMGKNQSTCLPCGGGTRLPSEPSRDLHQRAYVRFKMLAYLETNVRYHKSSKNLVEIPGPQHTYNMENTTQMKINMYIYKIIKYNKHCIFILHTSVALGVLAALLED